MLWAGRISGGLDVRPDPSRVAEQPIKREQQSHETVCTIPLSFDSLLLRVERFSATDRVKPEQRSLSLP